MDVGRWLRSIGLGQYEAVFRDNQIEADVLSELTDQHLKDLGVSLGHRLRLLRAIRDLAADAQLKPQPAAPTAPSSADGFAERRLLTVMFCDLVGSTALSARLDLEDLREVIGAYQAAVADEVGRSGGFIAKYMGDGVLIYFGYPQAHEDDAEQALRAGLAVVDRIGRLEFSGTRLAIRVGVATGVVVVGDRVGAGAAQERGVVGETPNLAARLQAIAPPNSVLIAETTRRLVGDLFEYRGLGTVEVKGLAEPARVWHVLRQSAIESRFKAFHAAELTPLVGREEEIELLARRWRSAKSGEGQTVVLSGEPGIGKSRLTAAIQELLGDEPHARQLYYCTPYHRDSALHPFIAQLERAAGFERDDTAEAKLGKLEASLAQSGEVDAQVPALFADLLELASRDRYPPLPQDPQRKREVTLNALLAQVEATARQVPVLMVFEDAHWADATSLELLDRAVARLARSRVLLVVTSRPEFQAPWAGQSAVSLVSLPRLAKRETGALASNVTAGKALPSDLLDQIFERTDGIPLFVEELTKSLIESGVLREDSGGYALDGPLPPMAIPASLQALLLARLDRYAPSKEAAQIGAALGREFSYELLAAVAHSPDDHLLDALDQLTEAGLVSRRGAGRDAIFIFKHALVQDAAYSTLLRGPRMELHARIGRTLEERFPDLTAAQPEILARHFASAGLIDAAVAYWQKAGERALQLSANAEASAHLTNAITLLASLPAEAGRNYRELRLQMALGSATRAIKGHAAPETLQVYSRARELLDETVPAKEQMAILYGHWSVSVVRGEYRPGLAVARQSLALTAGKEDPEAIAFASRMMGISLWGAGEFADAVPHLERAVRLYAPGSGNKTDLRYSQDHAVWALSMLGLTLWPLGYPDKARDAAATALTWAGEIQHAMTTGFALCFGLALWGQSGIDPSPSGDLGEAAIAYCLERDLRAYIPWARFYRGLKLVRRAEYAEGLEEMDAAIEAAQKIHTRMFMPGHLGHLAWARAKTGDLESGLCLLAKAIEDVNEKGERVFEAELHRLRGDFFARSGRVSEGETEFTNALEIARLQRAKSLELRAAMSLAWLWRDQGRRTEAANLLAPVYGWFTEGFATDDLRQAKALLEEVN